MPIWRLGWGFKAQNHDSYTDGWGSPIFSLQNLGIVTLSIMCFVTRTYTSLTCISLL